MALIILASATGSPGVTTTALGLTLNWPRDVLLADCDRDPAQVIQAGYLRGYNFEGRGLLGLSRIHRQGGSLTQDVWLQAAPLSTDQAPRRRFLAGFNHPGAAALFQGVWPALAEAFLELGNAGTDVIVDAGRLGRAGLPAALVTAADAVLVVVRSSLRAVAALRLHLPGLLEQTESLPGHADVGLLVVGDRQPYNGAEIADALHQSVWASIVYDAGAAAVLSDGEPNTRRYQESTLPRSLKATASKLLEQIERSTHERHGSLGALR